MAKLRPLGVWDKLLVRLLVVLFHLLIMSWRVRVHASKESLTRMQAGKVILCCWHEHLLAGLIKIPLHQPHALVSRSKDGQFLAVLLASFGINAIHGSSTDLRKKKDKGGREAYREMAQKLADGASLLITPDGPKGPARTPRAGAIHVARQANTPIIAGAITSSFSWRAPTWDKMLVPLPFARVDVFLGPVLAPPDDADGDWLAIQINQMSGAKPS